MVFLVYLLVGFGCGLPGKFSFSIYDVCVVTDSRLAWGKCINHGGKSKD